MGLMDPHDGFLGDSKASQILRIVTLILVFLVLGGVFTLTRNVGDLDKDDQLINRGQEATVCVGDLSDDKFDWLFVAVGEVFDQIQAVSEGGEANLTNGREAIANGRKVADLQEEARQIHSDLLAAADPDAGFVCPEIPDELDPNQIPIEP